MVSKKSKVQDLKDTVEAQMVDATALAVAPKVVGVSSEIVAAEMQLAHETSFADRAVEIKINKDISVIKAAQREYRNQEQEVKDKIRETLAGREKATKAVSSAIEDFKLQVIRDKLIPLWNTKAKAENKCPYLDGEFEILKPTKSNTITRSRDEDKFDVSSHEPNAESKVDMERKGYISWSFDFSTKGSGYHRDGVRYRGNEPYNAAVISAIKDQEALEEEITGYKKTLADISKSIDDLEDDIEAKEEQGRAARDELNARLMGSTVTGAKMMEMVEKALPSMKTIKVKALPFKA
jgi:hypothetical protein